MKKDSTRFTIRFNPADPRQLRAMQALETSGRRKAALIADAICEYLALHDGNGAAVRLNRIKQMQPCEQVHTAPCETEGPVVSINTSVPDTDEADTNEAKDDLTNSIPFDDEMQNTILGGLSMFIGE